MSDRESTNKATTTESLCTGLQTKVGEICLDPDKTPHCGGCIQEEVISIHVMHRIPAAFYFYDDLSQFVDLIKLFSSASYCEMCKICDNSTIHTDYPKTDAENTAICFWFVFLITA